MQETDLATLFDPLQHGQRVKLARALTLVESTRSEHAVMARQILDAALSRPQQAMRIGISGVPGVGKSTFIEALGTRLLGRGKHLAVLTVDPTSPRTGGSILGDKTRMSELSTDRRAYVRPSPTSGNLGGVARMTRESMLVLEASGYDVIIVETVGVGQSEVVVSGMVDLFMVLMMPGTGDELQGIKKGILEIADLIVVNKADGDLAQKAALAAEQYRRALMLTDRGDTSWQPPVLTTSAVQGNGLEECLETIEHFFQTMGANGAIAKRRQSQRLDWFNSALSDQLLGSLMSSGRIADEKKRLEMLVIEGAVSPYRAAITLVEMLIERSGGRVSG